MIGFLVRKSAHRPRDHFRLHTFFDARHTESFFIFHSIHPIQSIDESNLIEILEAYGLTPFFNEIFLL